MVLVGRENARTIPTEHEIFHRHTDHNALRWMLSLNDAKRKLSRWRLKLSIFYYYIVNQSDINHQAVALISRLDTKGKETKAMDDKFP